jgi:transcriptional regulator with GAF, ATPase, and Fis domain
MTSFEQRRKLLQLEALYDIGRALNTLRPEEELVDGLLQQAMQTLDATIGFAFSVDDRLQMRHLFVIGVPASESILREAAVIEAMEKRQPISSHAQTFLGTPGGALIAAPMLSGDKIIGVIGVVGKEARGSHAVAFVDDDLRFLESIASIAGAAIENSRNYHLLERMRESLEDENRSLRERMLREINDRLMIGDSLIMQRVLDRVVRVADSHASVLIRGESGTGKEMVARLIHGNSPRKDRAFVAINCAALPETLLESELFGIERGVATGVEARIGKFELASGGTIFLDEIGDIPLTLQAKLLRVVQEREVEKVGGRRRIPVDVRILAATHRNLEKMIEGGDFRQDLYYRLRVVEIVLPPLRQRREDIPKLVRYFIDKYSKREGLSNVRVTQDGLQKLMRYPFPGNVRELENLIEGALALTVDPVIGADDILIPDAAETQWTDVEGGFVELREWEKRYIQKVLAHTGGNLARAARILGIDRKTLYRRRDEFQNDPSVPFWDVH